MPSQLCLNCLEDTGGAAPCPHCQWQQGVSPYDPLYLPPGTILKEQYVAGRVLGHGGFGITYLGWDTHLARKIAIKEYFPSGVSSRQSQALTVLPSSPRFQTEYQWGLERFLDEARTVARFENHPNIVWVRNYFLEHGTAYMVLEYLDGITLDAFIQRQGGRLAWATTMRIMTPVMDALREVHSVGLLHRDISPDNIFLLRSGHVKVIDFGAARYSLGQYSRNLSVILKPGYAPPEQYQTKGNQGPWTDVYAVACTMHRAVTGEIPPPAPDRVEQDELAPPSTRGIDIPPAAEQALMKALSLKVADRFPGMAEFQQALLTGVVVPPPPEPTPPPAPIPVPPPPRPVPDPTPWPRTRWAWIAGGAAAFLLLVLYLFLRPGPPPPEVRYFRAASARIEAGGETTLQWSVSGVDEVEIAGLGKLPATGSRTVKPDSNTTYILRASVRDKSVEQQVQVDVVPVQAAQEPVREPEPPPPSPEPGPVVVPGPGPVAPQAPEIERFEFSPRSVPVGGVARLSWNVRRASRVVLEPGNRLVPASGTLDIRGERSVEARLTAYGAAGAPAVARAALTVEASAGPEILSFTASPPSSPRPGGPVTLRWQWRGAPRAVLRISTNPVPMTLPADMQEMEMLPRESTRYTLVVTDARGVSVSRSLDVAVESAAPPVVVPPVPGPNPVRLSFVVYHHHGKAGLIPGPIDIRSHRGSVQLGRGDLSCTGTLSVEGTRLIFRSRNFNDGFQAALSDVEEIKGNRMSIAGNRAFHVKLRKGDNYNFVPAEQMQLVLEALQKRLP